MQHKITVKITEAKEKYGLIQIKAQWVNDVGKTCVIERNIPETKANAESFPYWVIEQEPDYILRNDLLDKIKITYRIDKEVDEHGNEYDKKTIEEIKKV